MGRPKGLRKGSDGKWYMPEQVKPTLAKTLVLPKQQAERIMDGAQKAHKSKPKEKSVRTAKIFEPRYQRNDFVAVQSDRGQDTGLVLGYVGLKVIVMLLDGRTLLTVDESRIVPNQDRIN